MFLINWPSLFKVLQMAKMCASLPMARQEVEKLLLCKEEILRKLKELYQGASSSFFQKCRRLHNINGNFLLQFLFRKFTQKQFEISSISRVTIVKKQTKYQLIQLNRSMYFYKKLQKIEKLLKQTAMNTPLVLILSSQFLLRDIIQIKKLREKAL